MPTQLPACHTDHTAWPVRSMAAQSRTIQSQVAERAIAFCRRVDEHARLSSMTEDAEGYTRLRMRAGDSHTIQSLRTMLNRMMPLASTRVTESLVDGTLEAEVTVLTTDQEHAAARALVTRQRFVSYWLLLAWTCFFVGVAEWLMQSSNVAFVMGDNATTAARDEL